MIEHCADVDYLREVATHPRVWPWISEDEDKPDDYEPELHKIVYLRVPGGYVSFRPFTRSCWEVHVCMLPKTQDVRAKVEACLGWMRARGVRSFLAKVPACNVHVIRLAKAIGFVECGRVKKCVHRGRMRDMVLMEY